jgi:hypothetical protein
MDGAGGGVAAKHRHMSANPHYRVPDWFIRNIFNRVVAITESVSSFWGSRILQVRGRKTSVPRRTPVNLLSLGGARYLVAPSRPFASYLGMKI